jgi:alpha-tubulin suppressor-like RCC1 family protein
MRIKIFILLFLVSLHWPSEAQVNTQSGHSFATPDKLIAVGYEHSLIVQQGKVYAWGKNFNGQLGVGPSVNLATPQSLDINIGSNIIAVAASYHSIALTADGKVWSWGLNDSGQLGIGNYFTAYYPVQVPNMTNVVAVAAGGGHTLALKADGTVWAWGSTSFGQLGIGTIGGSSNIPVQVKGVYGQGMLTDVIAISAGSAFSLALKADGTVYAWGMNSLGQLGNMNVNSNFQYPVPINDSDVTGIVAIAANLQNHCLAIRHDGKAIGWGDNREGQLGDGTSGPNNIIINPIVIPSLDNVKAIATDWKRSVFLKADGSTWFSGGTTTVVQPVGGGFNNIIALAGGGNHNLALDANGVLYGWGQNGSGQLGNGTFFDSPNPIKSFQILEEIKAIAASGELQPSYPAYYKHLSATLSTWGEAKSNGLFTIPAGIPDFIAVSAGFARVVALGADGTVWEARLETDGEFHQVLGLVNIVSISSGLHHNLALTSNGTILSWGQSNLDWQLGRPTNNPPTPNYVLIQTGPASYSPLNQIKAIAAGDRHSMALTASGAVRIWGANDEGQLGIGNIASYTYVNYVSNISNIRDISCGGFHSMAITSNGKAWAWGSNTVGQLSIGNNTTPQTLPTAMKATGFSDITNVKALQGGYRHSLALTANGIISTSGLNVFGQLGLNNINNANLFTAIPSHPYVKSLAGGSTHSLILKSNGVVCGAGQNWDNQLGMVLNGSSFTFTCGSNFPAFQNALPIVNPIFSAERIASTSYPNPVNGNNGKLTMLLPFSGNVTVTVYTISGDIRQTESFEHVQTQLTLPLKNLNPGLYKVRAVSSTGEVSLTTIRVE